MEEEFEDDVWMGRNRGGDDDAKNVIILIIKFTKVHKHNCILYHHTQSQQKIRQLNNYMNYFFFYFINIIYKIQSENPDEPMENPQEVLTECLSKFSTSDYIMEPGIFAQLKRYV